MSCFTDSELMVDGTTLLYLLMILINIVILMFITLTTESFENHRINLINNGFRS